MNNSTEQRFWAKVEKTDTCWNWTGWTSKGYGRFDLTWLGNGKTKKVRAHRHAYEQLVGPIPAGMVLDHLCRNRRCVNPDHLEPVTDRENILRGTGATAVNAAKTHCKHGHAFDKANTRHTAQGRVCRACANRKERQRHTQYAQA